MRLICGAAFCALLAWTGNAALAAPPGGADFSLRDHRGPMRSLSEFADKRVVVLAFLGTECPAAEKYAGRLAEMAREFDAAGVQFLGIDSNRQDSLSDIAAQVARHDLPFPMLKDPENRVADQFAARRTPEVIVLDEKRAVRYQGRIDDQFAPGVSRPAPTRADLRLAIESLLAGEEVQVTQTVPVGCLIGRVRRNSALLDPSTALRAGKPAVAHTDTSPIQNPKSKIQNPQVTYSGQIAEILDRRCVECHRSGQAAPFPLTDYDEVVGWAEMIAEVVREERMPPWFADPAHGEFVNDARMTAEEKQSILAWVDEGAPVGDRRRIPKPTPRVEGWRIPTPDLVVRMSEKPFEVPAEGTLGYQIFHVDPGLKEDKWVRFAEARPGNRAVVHHLEVKILPPEERKFTGQELGRVTFAPGTPPLMFPEGTAMLVPAGATFRFAIHYTPNGRPQQDTCELGLVFAAAESVVHRAGCGLVSTADFVIPAGAGDFPVVAESRVTKDVHLIGLCPHMHLRGKSFRFEAIFPDGRSETLLNVPRFNFDWQQGYYLKRPKLLPAGTRIRCEAIYDNSAENLSNPDPTEAVGFGEQTWQEMMEGYFAIYFDE